MPTFHDLAHDTQLYEILSRELARQRKKLQMIASENYVSMAVLAAGASVFTNKYAEGYPDHRYYGGCENADDLEILTQGRARKLFGAEHANVQPHCGSSANMASYFSVLKPGDTILGMNLTHGGHLTHGAPVSFSGKLFKTAFYGVRKDTEYIDYEALAEIAERVKPQIIVAGASSYPRIIDFPKFREVADRCGAYLMVDMAHFSGLVAAGLFPSPVPHADIVSTTTHKTLRGPRGGMILCRKNLAKAVDEQIFPGIQGGPLLHVIAAKAVALGEALEPEFIDYQRQVLKNCQRLGTHMTDAGYRLVSGGTDTHLILIDLRPSGINGQEAQTALDMAGITANRNVVPFEKECFSIASGLRLGTPALTTRGMIESDIDVVGEFIVDALRNVRNESRLNKIRMRVEDFIQKFPIYPDLKG
ncbi:MAG: serine hydroxymethyltransferase [Deltaproteobacteria bacterium]|jgi:glycine hydroxymethyltransferase|nr:serine hydroxymethyltransferase [Deltaproteobacteria bacterium]